MLPKDYLVLRVKGYPVLCAGKFCLMGHDSLEAREALGLGGFEEVFALKIDFKVFFLRMH